MLNKDDCFYLGSISRTKGIKGFLVASLDVDFPEQYSNLDAVYLEINKQLVPFFIQRILVTPKGFAEILFSEINSIEKAKELLKKEIYLPLNLLPRLKENQFYFHEVIGYKVIDTNFGEIGNIKEIIENAHNPIMVVKQKAKEILIPITDSFIEKVDKKNETITVITPNGLIDLYSV